MLHGETRLIGKAERDRLISGADPQLIMREGGVAWTDRAVEILGGEVAPPAKPIHPRVKKLLRRIHSGEIDPEQSLDALAEVAGLSSSRLMHAFTESIGIPIRPYLAWLRLQRAAAGIAGGATLTRAAHEAGFSDAAHMTRTFRRMFGVPPSALRPRDAS